MTSKNLGNTLQEMASTHGSRADSDRLRDVYEDVEKALQSGVSRKAVLEALHADGFKFTLRSFETALYRIRSKNKLNGLTAPVKKVEAPKALPSAVSSTPRTFKHNPTPPADLLD